MLSTCVKLDLLLPCKKNELTFRGLPEFKETHPERCMSLTNNREYTFIVTFEHSNIYYKIRSGTNFTMTTISSSHL